MPEKCGGVNCAEWSHSPDCPTRSNGSSSSGGFPCLIAFFLIPFTVPLGLIKRVAGK